MQIRRSAMKLNFRKCFWGIALLFMAVHFQSNAAANDAALWSNANQLYKQKKYDSAAKVYGLLLKDNNANAELHYNTGNAYYKMNRIGLAVLHYEKAAHLDPSNDAINDNLLLARSKVQDNMQADPIFFVAWWKALNHAVSANAWAIIAFAVFLILLSLIYFSRVKKDNFPHAGRWIALSAVSFLLCAAMTWIAYHDFSHPDKAVVTTTNAVFLQTPQSNGKVIGSLPEGLVLEILENKDGYLHVQLQNGKSGWIAASEVGIV